MNKLFDIFPRPFHKYYEEGTSKCVQKDCSNCTYYDQNQRKGICFDICLKGDFDLFRHSYDMSKPLLRRYVGSYEFDMER